MATDNSIGRLARLMAESTVALIASPEGLILAALSIALTVSPTNTLLL